ncbi:hypothetical protein Lal_00022774 [Lupinus albus]|nr:hypothetical protein Lal_00022774 [Lupinus albus]
MKLESIDKQIKALNQIIHFYNGMLIYVIQLLFFIDKSETFGTPQVQAAWSRMIHCEEDLAPDLDTVLMKTPISQKEERKKTDKDC